MPATGGPPASVAASPLSRPKVKPTESDQSRSVGSGAVKGVVRDQHAPGTCLEGPSV